MHHNTPALFCSGCQRPDPKQTCSRTCQLNQSTSIAPVVSLSTNPALCVYLFCLHHTWTTAMGHMPSCLQFGYRISAPMPGRSKLLLPAEAAAALRDGNSFQNRSVSSPAPVTTVSPSGAMAKYRTREVWPDSVATLVMDGYFHTTTCGRGSVAEQETAQQDSSAIVDPQYIGSEAGSGLNRAGHEVAWIGRGGG